MASAKPSSLVDTRVIYCGHNAPPSPAAISLRSAPERLRDNSPALQGWVIRAKMPGVPTGTKERFCRPFGTFSIWVPRFPALKRWAIFKAITRAYIATMRPRCVEMARVLKKTGSFYYHCDWHASHYVKVMLHQKSNLAY